MRSLRLREKKKKRRCVDKYNYFINFSNLQNNPFPRQFRESEKLFYFPKKRENMEIFGENLSLSLVERVWCKNME